MVGSSTVSTGSCSGASIALRRDLTAVIRRHRPDVLIGINHHDAWPGGWNHIDHRVVGVAMLDAARGMGLTDGQVLRQIELPLALPTILTGIRIVLVQNIGMVTIAALIGGGGFGAFVFQGIGQTAIDLVLLGAIPTVVLAFSAAVVLDALTDLTRRVPR